jgi:hypothetical protein
MELRPFPDSKSDSFAMESPLQQRFPNPPQEVCIFLIDCYLLIYLLILGHSYYPLLVTIHICYIRLPPENPTVNDILSKLIVNGNVVVILLPDINTALNEVVSKLDVIWVVFVIRVPDTNTALNNAVSKLAVYVVTTS